MPHENREIVFSMNEFLEALMRYNEMRGGVRYRVHQLRSAGVEKSKNGLAELTFDDGETVGFGETDVLAALIANCIEHKVPLPARAGKKLIVTDDTVKLVIESKTDWVAPVPIPLKVR